MEVNHSESTNVVSNTEACSNVTHFNSSETADQSVSIDDFQTFPQNSKIENKHLSHKIEDPFSICQMKKGYNIGHLIIQGLCGDKLSKFSEISLMLTSKENEKLHIFGMSETKLKNHKPTGSFEIDGFQTPFRNDNNTNGGGV